MRRIGFAITTAVLLGAIWINLPTTVHRVQPEDDVDGMFPAATPTTSDLSSITSGHDNIAIGYAALSSITPGQCLVTDAAGNLVGATCGRKPPADMACIGYDACQWMGVPARDAP